MKSYPKKVVIGGHFNAGKTTFVKTVSGEHVMTMEKGIRERETTTVGFDYGKLKLPDGQVIHVVGLPGQERFSMLWDVVSKNAVGYIFLLDSTDRSRWHETKKQMEILLKDKELPYLLALNKQDLPNAKRPEELKPLILKEFPIKDESLIIPLIALNKESCFNALLKLLKLAGYSVKV